MFPPEILNLTDPPSSLSLSSSALSLPPSLPPTYLAENVAQELPGWHPFRHLLPPRHVQGHPLRVPQVPLRGQRHGRGGGQRLSERRHGRGGGLGRNGGVRAHPLPPPGDQRGLRSSHGVRAGHGPERGPGRVQPQEPRRSPLPQGGRSHRRGGLVPGVADVAGHQHRRTGQRLHQPLPPAEGDAALPARRSRRGGGREGCQRAGSRGGPEGGRGRPAGCGGGGGTWATVGRHPRRGAARPSCSCRGAAPF